MKSSFVFNPNSIEEFIESRFQEESKGSLEISSLTGEFSPLPKTLNPELKEILVQSGINKLYSHQAIAFESISNRNDTLLLSRTASGKTLSFLLPILNEYSLSPKPFSVLLLYPTKALSRDQESTLGRLLRTGTRGKFGTYDGDTSKDDRELLVKQGDFIITNPDMLHSGILPNHSRKWKQFLSKLRYVVVDEVHTYRGAFGSHVSNVFRRLLRVASNYGSSPSFVCLSATIGNPKEHSKALFHKDFFIIDKDSSPRGEKTVHFLNPRIDERRDGTEYRKSTASVSIPLIQFATRNNIRTICFCRARQEVEKLYQAVTDSAWELKNKIRPYRSGLLPLERREIEADLFSGKVNTIITTNALELGIDIGDMALCILSGYPGTVSSFWQQAGRVGRNGKKANIVFIGKDSAIDQYILHHKEFLTKANWEEAWLSADNPYILLQHLPCAAYEYPLSIPEKNFDEDIFPLAVETLVKNETLRPYKNYFRYSKDDYPSKGVSLRGLTDYNISISHNGHIIGEIDPIGAMGSLYKDAIYQHFGKKFISTELNMEKKICFVEEVFVDYFTEANWENNITLTSEEEVQTIQTATLRFGYIHVVREPKLYKKIKEKTMENVGYGPITLNPFVYDTMGFALELPPEWKEKISIYDPSYVESALLGLSYILRQVAPSMSMGDANDIYTDCSIGENNSNTFSPQLYVYDSVEGGAGFSEKIFQRFEETLTLCKSIIEECECENGCPACIPAASPELTVEEGELYSVESNKNTETALSLIHFLLVGEFKKPIVQIFKTKRNSSSKKDNPEKEKILKRLDRSYEILQNKKARIH
ncbi:MAG: DEAD/DEAH box helicase [Leptospiraceae bacterium]|nr:DEAD/DEAH box helicase [Leptospiraceae bacterium]